MDLVTLDGACHQPLLRSENQPDVGVVRLSGPSGHEI